MSSSPTGPTSTTGSSTCSRSRASRPPGAATGGGERRVALVACGAIAQPCAELAAELGWPLDVHPLPPLLHNQPQRIAGAVERLAVELLRRYPRVAVGYADCGTYGAVDEVCDRLGLRRVAGLHCYDIFAGAERMRAMLADEPGTYVLTDFLVRSFDRTVVAELGLDRYPELRDDYFGHYSRVVWLAQRPDPQLRALAERAAARIGLPLTVVDTGRIGLAASLRDILGPDAENPAAEFMPDSLAAG